MNKVQKRVLKTKYKDNCFILSSGAKRPMKETLGDFRVKVNMSFVYVAGDWAAEWEPEHGPIQVWHRCEEDAEGAKEHYLFDYTDSGPMNWSQMAVDNYELPKAFNQGDFDYIYNTLKGWAIDR